MDPLHTSLFMKDLKSHRYFVWCYSNGGSYIYSQVKLSESETERLFNIIDTTKSGYVRVCVLSIYCEVLCSKIGQSLWTEQFMNCREVQDALNNNQVEFGIVCELLDASRFFSSWSF